MKRDNGLEADTFAFVGTVSAGRSDELLDDLAAEGIAAYAVSGAPEERLYVDRGSLGYAKALVQRSGASVDDSSTTSAAEPEPEADVDVDVDVDGGASADSDETTDDTGDEHDAADGDDAAWERIVADFDRTDDTDADDADRPWPDAEDLADDPEGESDGEQEELRTVGKKGAKVSVIRLDTDKEDDETDDDHYVKPEPPPLPNGDLWTKFAWVAMLAALAYPITGLILDWDMPGWSIALAVVVFIAGIVTHVVRLRDPRTDGHSDDGAVV